MENKNLEHLPHDSAGRILTDKVPTVLEKDSISSVEKILIEKVKEFENLSYVYVISDRNILKGVLSVKEVFKTPKETPVRDIMVRNLVSVRPHTDRERVVLLAIEHGLKNVPVINREGVFLGVVTSDIILKTLHEEGIEDMLRSTGILKTYSVHKFLSTKWPTHIKQRLPWLLVGLFGGMLAAFVVSFFENILSEVILLAAFIPAVVYMADAVGAQTQTIFVRSLSLPDKIVLKDYFKKEISVSFFLSILLGLTAFVLIFWLWGSFDVALIVSFSFVLTIIIAALIGIILPWIFFKFKLDPAITSGPFATVLRDILSIAVYFLVAVFFLNLF